MVISVGSYEKIGGREGSIWKEKTKMEERENERNLNETIIGSRCSLWTSNKKMES